MITIIINQPKPPKKEKPRDEFIRAFKVFKQMDLNYEDMGNLLKREITPTSRINCRELWELFLSHKNRY